MKFNDRIDLDRKNFNVIWDPIKCISDQLLWDLQIIEQDGRFFKEKRNLKGTNISRAENLTHTRYELYKSAISKFGKGKVWTSDGRITTKVNDQYVIIKSAEDLE